MRTGPDNRPKLYTFIPDTEIESRRPPEYLIGGILPKSALVVLFGEPGSCKTFLALDWAFSVGTGRNWQGRTITQGLVLYINAERSTGLPNRIKAWKIVHEYQGDANVWFLEEAVNFLYKGSEQLLLASIAALSPKPVLVVIDTMARCFGDGDENSANPNYS